MGKKTDFTPSESRDQKSRLSVLFGADEAHRIINREARHESRQGPEGASANKKLTSPARFGRTVDHTRSYKHRERVTEGRLSRGAARADETTPKEKREFP